MWLAFSLFLFSLFGIVGLFGFKKWEVQRNRVVAPHFRDQADQWAFRAKELLIALQADLEKLPPEILIVSRLIVQEIALATAALLRFLSVQAHRLADLVSHKHHFERRAPRSEFLNKVMEHPIRDLRSNGAGKNGSGNGSDKLDTSI